MDILFNNTMRSLSGMLDYRSARHKVILSNVANIDTVGFKPSDISFKNTYEKTNTLPISTTDPKHIGQQNGTGDSASYEIKTSEEAVKVDTEMANLAENHLMYNMTVEMLARKFKGLNTVLKETK